MKLVRFATIVAVAGIAQVLAVPIVLVSNNTPSHPHLGHAVVTKTEFVGKKGCFRFRQKAVEISNLLREALGMPLIKISNHHGPSDEGKVRLLPFIGTSSNTFVPAHGQDAGGAIKIISIEAPDGRHHRHHAHGRHRHHRHHHGKGSFINRIHHSIMNLGRWEGRAVAFVLGCGIGVLLRMLFVLGVVTYRAMRGQRGEEQHGYSQITIIEEIVDNSNSSPPSYVDEKVPFVDEPVQTPKSSLPSYVSESYPIIIESVKAPTTTEESK